MTQKHMLLGTALWGWGVEKPEAFAMLDAFASYGGELVDTATNYPINKQAEQYGVALEWFTEWARSHPGAGVKALVKMGALDNLGNPDHDLRASRLQGVIEELLEQLGDALAGVAIHWDNRTDAAQQEVLETLQLFEKYHQQGYAIGFSGVQSPHLYAELMPALRDAWVIQVKENLLTTQARERYQKAFPDATYIAYGINLGGLKARRPSGQDSLQLRGIEYPQRLVERMQYFLDASASLQPSPQNFYDLALLLAYTNPHLSGVIAGSRTVEQLQQTSDYWKALSAAAAKVDGLPSYNYLLEQLVPQ